MINFAIHVDSGPHCILLFTITHHAAFISRTFDFVEHSCFLTGQWYSCGIPINNCAILAFSSGFVESIIYTKNLYRLLLHLHHQYNYFSWKKAYFKVCFKIQKYQTIIIIFIYMHMWLDLRKASFHACNSKTHFPPLQDSCTH